MFVIFVLRQFTVIYFIIIKLKKIIQHEKFIPHVENFVLKRILSVVTSGQAIRLPRQSNKNNTQKSYKENVYIISINFCNTKSFCISKKKNVLFFLFFVIIIIILRL